MHLSVLACLLNLPLTLTLPYPKSTSETSSSNNQVSGQTVHQFPVGSWVENVAVRSNGQLLTTLISEPLIYILDPVTKVAKLLHSFAPEKAAFGITELTPSLFYTITSTNFSISPPSLGAGSYSISSIDLTSYHLHSNTGAVVKHVVSIPESPFLNGLTTLSVSRGLLLASASIDGKVWIIDVKKRSHRLLAQGAAFESPAGSKLAWVNGIRVRSGGSAYGGEDDVKEIYFSNQGAATFSRFNITISTLAITTPEVVYAGIVIDDFALGLSGSGRERVEVAYAASRENEVVRIPLRGGEAVVLYGGLNETALAGPTSVVLGREGKEGKVFVSTNGGLIGPVNGTSVQGGKVVELDVGC